MTALPIDQLPLLGAIGGALLGLSAALLWVVFGRAVAMSEAIAELPSGRVEPWIVVFLGAVAVGGALASLSLRGLLGIEPVSTMLSEGPMLALAGAFLAGLGGRIAYECSIGHALEAITRLYPAALVAILVFFGAAVSTAMLVGVLG
jgi:YeeE/YedE family (DUF395).